MHEHAEYVTMYNTSNNYSSCTGVKLNERVRQLMVHRPTIIMIDRRLDSGPRAIDDPCFPARRCVPTDTPETEQR